MKKKVKISIYYEQVIDREKNSSELMLKGELLYGLNDSYIISYDEYNGEFENCHVTVTVRDKKTVSLVRRGNYCTDIYIENGKSQSSEYMTPFGSFPVTVFGEKVCSDIDFESGSGTLLFAYSIDFSGNYISKNKIRIKITPSEERN